MSVEIKMAWRNVWRNPRRTLLTVAAIAFACILLVFMLSWQFGAYDAMINASVKMSTGHLQIQAEEYMDKRDIRLAVSDPKAVGLILDRTDAVAAHTFRASAFSLVSSEERTYGALVVGVDPVREPNVSNLKSLIRQGSFLSEDDFDKALIGKMLAKNLRIGIGDELTVLGQGRDGSIAATVLKIKGIYSSGNDDFDRNSIQIALKAFQEVYSMRGGVHEVVANVKSLSDVADVKKIVASEIRSVESKKSLVALDWTDLTPGLIQAIYMDLGSGIIFYIILIIMVAFSILNTFIMAIFERTREFGVLMAMGTAPGRLVKLLLAESTFLTLVGVIVGTAVGCVLAAYFQVHGFEIAGTDEMMKHWGLPGRMHTKLTWISATAGPAAVMFITFLTALFPALKVRSLSPVEALNFA